MTPFPYSVTPDDPLTRAAALMREHAINHLPVQQGPNLVGIVSARDIQVATATDSSSSSASSLKVSGVCTRDPYVVSMDEPLADVLDAMASRHIGSVLVTRHGKLAGIFTYTDACSAFSAVLRAGHRPNDAPEAA